MFEDAVTGAELFKNNKIDLLFIDINIPDITGVDLVRALGDDKPMVGSNFDRFSSISVNVGSKYFIQIPDNQ